MEAVPVVMRVIRAEMRLRGGQFASVPQLRALGLVHRQPGASLTDVAAHLGVTPATASVLVDRLVRRGLLHRASDPQERRRIRLSLTREGSQHLRAARTGTRRRLAEVLGALPAPDRAAISAGVSLLRHAFASRNGAKRDE
jgi:DNA-binding MarR family transcriptional regulator